MSQTFQPGTPAPNSVPQSVIIRDNFESLLTQHAGSSEPPYAAEGMVWYDTVSKRLKKAATYGSKARGVWAMGAQINVAVSTPTGIDGSTITASVKLQDNTLLPSDDHIWTLSPTNLDLFFRDDTTPAYFAGRVWNNVGVEEPILWTADGTLLGKTWEAIPGPGHENVYGTGPLSNDGAFADNTVRFVGIEHADQVIATEFSVADNDIDHVVLPLNIQWWEFQDVLQIELYENGAKRSASTFKARPFFDGSAISMVVYNIEPIGQVLQPFDQLSSKEIIFRKNV
jgi:hypothetical protein